MELFLGTIPLTSVLIEQENSAHMGPSGFTGALHTYSYLTSGCNDSLLIILTDRGLYLLKHKYVTSILSKFLPLSWQMSGFFNLTLLGVMPEDSFRYSWQEEYKVIR